MGCYCSKTIYNDDTTGKRYSITVLGLPGTGKSSVVEYISGEYDQRLRPISTYGVIVKTVEYIDSIITFYDCGGTLDHEFYWNTSLRKSNAVIILFDPLSIHYGYSYTRDLLEMTAPIINELNIPILAVLMKTKSNKDVSRIQKLLDMNFSDSTIRFSIHSTLSEEFLDDFHWLLSEVRRNIVFL